MFKEIFHVSLKISRFSRISIPCEVSTEISLYSFFKFPFLMALVYTFIKGCEWR